MTAIDLTSGDLIADRRADYARMLASGGDMEAAAELMEQALELAPGWAAGWFLLGDYREKAGLKEPAIAAYRQVLTLSKDDIFGAGLKLSILGDRAQPATPPVAYVEQLFDDYADRFETALVEKLDYKVPGRLAALIADKGRAIYARAIDLGCGTGLMGVELSGRVEHLEGYDLSANMLAKAEDKGIYHHLDQADLSLGPREARLIGPELAAGRADLVAAADVLMYLGDLEPVLALSAALLADGGHVAFSVEHLMDARDDFRLQPSLRYAHSPAYIERLLAAHGFTLLGSEKLVIRMDGGVPVNGILFIAEKRPAA
ncbi:methyltransferase domain-containing protein [Rhizobium sp. C4]|uniref:methyltransferase domain-containing protein n=1 Tax=Rhizobium sp. C4 TaxID=1349800 RepID=UPI001E449742|nr:methyltransferase domain-containing protein [Rhizobium sp. C4]MCD2174592.1 methyltransferase domain-containing protein [Rhizobium sp. C4]